MDKAVALDSKSKQTNLCTTWINYRNDESMLHGFVNVILYKVNRIQKVFIEDSMGL